MILEKLNHDILVPIWFVLFLVFFIHFLFIYLILRNRDINRRLSCYRMQLIRKPEN